MAATAFTPEFMEGFVQDCYHRGLTLDETETLFRKHANACFLATPHIYDGFREGLQKASASGMTKAALTKYLGPDMMALVVDCRIKYANDALCEVMRAALGLPEPSWETVDDELQKVATGLAQQFSGFQSMPMQQQLLIAALVGGGLGGAKRMVLPNAEDKNEGRGVINRTLRGVARGSATGAGAAGGAMLGRSLAGPRNGMVGNLAGAAAGGLAGNELGKLVAG